MTVLEPHPEPLVRAIEVNMTDARVPRAARGVVAEARKLDWRCSTQYACGNTLTGAQARVGVLTHSVVVRMKRGHRRIVAWWHRSDNVEKYVFKGAYVTENAFTTAKRASADDLRRFIREAP